MITDLRLVNFSLFKDFSISFRETKVKTKRLVLLYGENGSGKTSIINAIKLLSLFSDALSASLNYERQFQDSSHNPAYIRPGGGRERFEVSGLTRGLHRIGSSSPMILEYKFDVEGKNIAYHVEIENAFIVKERLTIGSRFVFDVGAPAEIHRLSESFIAKDLHERIASTVGMFFGRFTMLSCLRVVFDGVNPDFIKNNVDQSLIAFLQFVETIGYDDAAEDFVRSAFVQNDSLLPNLVNGLWTADLFEKMTTTKKLLKGFLCSFNSRVVDVDYDLIQPQASESKYYSLVFIEDQGEQHIRVPYYLQSRGIQKIISLFADIIDAKLCGKLILVDEIDSSISEKILSEIIFKLSEFESFSGQLIATTHNSSIMENKIKKCCYVIQRADDKKDSSARSLDSFGRKIQEGSNVQGQFSRNEFGGVPSIDEESFLDIDRILKQVEKIINSSTANKTALKD